MELALILIINWLLFIKLLVNQAQAKQLFWFTKEFNKFMTYLLFVITLIVLSINNVFGGFTLIAFAVIIGLVTVFIFGIWRELNGTNN